MAKKIINEQLWLHPEKKHNKANIFFKWGPSDSLCRNFEILETDYFRRIKLMLSVK